MKYDPEAQDALNREHAKNPKVGDYWSDHFCPVAVVVSVTPYYVITIEKTKSVDPDHWTWDVEAKPNIYTRKEFFYRFTYGRCGNDTFEGTDDPKDIKNRYWADVSPERHKWIEEELCSTVS